MASDHQMAVARTGRSLPPATLSKSTRQVVPAFLQKLYEMVNDPKNSDLIRWSDAGDSFFVLDHERFAHDVLGRWFKHRNFSSFVRQLNMYGFHKIPHLQQGVLKSDTETEYWNFAHANFHRGQPDMLCLIQRKKTANQSISDDISMDIPTSSNATTTSQGQVLDVQSIVSGISAIKRHQTTISAELNELKRSNQLLWQDAMAARAKHQKQQDTINRIVKFLAGVFGGQAKDAPVQDNSPQFHVPRRQARLMIEDAKRDGKNIVEMDDLEAFPSAGTPITIVTAPSPAPSDTTTTTSEPTPAPRDQTPVSPVQHPEPQTPQPDPSSGVDVRSVTPTRLNPAPMYDFDQRMQGVLNQLSPAQIQQLVNSLSSQPIPDPSLPTNPPVPSSSSMSNTNTLTHYSPPPFDFSSLTNPSNNGALAPSLQLPPPSEGLIAFNPYDHLSQERLDRSWHATEDIDKDVNALNSSIHQLIQTFGLDPTLVGTNDPTAEPPIVPTSINEHGIEYPIRVPNSTATDLAGNATGASNPSHSTGTVGSDPTLPLDLNGGPSADFDFDSFFFNNDAGGDGNMMDYTADAASTAFLDEVPSPAHSARAVSPMMGLRGLSPEVSTAGAGTGAAGGNSRKRKSDVSELDFGAGGALGLGLGGVRPSALLQPDVGAAVSSILQEGRESSAGVGSKAKRRKEK
ncbi:hypothetical protein EST38_g1636 [Candolleomyces aberdarensis]|uniref:HSF-type DNA-binding domain-containing protein n=1 Tax=Candolleomyces aberdarensis TaxID=2316362 RepID=A0A4Q2DVH9_9AGAR|nr:hypothetical protein EST38_g1636 [Candolleomyces aberdarensis]